MPQPRGLGFVMRVKVDADHASDTTTRHSRMGFLVYFNCAPIYWWSKKQNSVESLSFGSEFIAMKQCCEYVPGLRYKLRMMGIPCEDPTFIYGGNQSVLANTTIPNSTLKKNPRVSPITLSEKELHGMNGEQPMSIPMRMKQTY